MPAAVTAPSSSPRTRGPITTGLSCCAKAGEQHLPKQPPRRRDERERSRGGPGVRRDDGGLKRTREVDGLAISIPFVVPAKAGTHNHRVELLRESRRTASFNTYAAAYGSRRSPGRRRAEANAGGRRTSDFHTIRRPCESRDP